MAKNKILINNNIQAIINIEQYKNKADEYIVSFIMNFNSDANRYINEVKFLANSNLISKIATSENTPHTIAYDIVAKLPKNAKIQVQAKDSKNKKYIYQTTLSESL